MARKLRIEYSGGVSRDSAWQPALRAFLGRHLWVFDWPANGLTLGFDMILSGFSISRPLVARSFLIVAVALLIASTFPLSAQPTNPMPGNLRKALALAHGTPPLPDGILSWDALSKTVEATNGQGVARPIYNFTNLGTNGITILSARPSCGCTMVEMPPVPWSVAAHAGGQIKLNVNLSGKVGTLKRSVQHNGI